jgi:hypothetical protein
MVGEAKLFLAIIIGEENDFFWEELINMKKQLEQGDIKSK